MKKRLLPFGFISLLLAGLIIFSYSSSVKERSEEIKGEASIGGAKDYLGTIRNNQHSGRLEARDVIAAREQLAAMGSRSADELNWQSMGPKNIAGRIRALIFDNQDANATTLYAGAVNGGLFKSTNLGVLWEEVNTGDQVLNITTLYQAADGTMYIGTGEGFYSTSLSGTEDAGLVTGFMGKGVFTYNPNDGTLTPLEGTIPSLSNTDFAYINEITESKSGKLMVATNSGLKVKTENGWAFAKTSDGTPLTGTAWDIKVTPSGTIFTSVDGESYKSEDGNVNHFESISGSGDLLPGNMGRIEFAVSATDENIVIASVSKTNGKLKNVYKSVDKGNTWTVIFPGGSNVMNLFTYKSNSYQGNYDNTVVTFPGDASRVLLGGLSLWDGKSIPGYDDYDWTRISDGFFESYLFPFYLHYDIHSIVFRPNHDNEVFIATDGGVFYTETGTTEHFYQARNKGLTTTQFYKVGVGTKKNVVLGGTQDNGTLLVRFNTLGEFFGENINKVNGISVASDGGYSVMSMMDSKLGNNVTDPGIMYASPDAHNLLGDKIKRSQTLGFDYSLNFLDSLSSTTSTTFLTPMLHRENFNETNSQLYVDFIAHQDYEAGDTIIAKSRSFKYPIQYILPTAVADSDTIAVQDIVVSRTFIAFQDEVYMTFDGVAFDRAPIWYKISSADSNGVSGNPSAIAYSQDGANLFVATMEGKIFRIDNVNGGYTTSELSVDSSTCVLTTVDLNFPDTTGQVITSIAVDPNDANKLLVSLGNYGNDNYVYFTSNALDDNPDFVSVQGNLPLAPVYATLLEMNDDNKAIIGTEHGVFVTDDITASTVSWSQSGTNIGDVPVFDIVQQTNRKEAFIIVLPDPGNPGHYINNVYSGAENYGSIYVATYGRGIFRDDTYWEPVGVNEYTIRDNTLRSLNVFPNPASDYTNISFTLKKASKVDIRIFDMNGRMVYQTSGKYPKGNNVLKHDLNSLTKGTYMVQIISEGSSRTSKLVVLR